jgi:hypothetical protein
MAASIIALSGGTLINGDRLVDLDPDRLEILRKVYPAHGVAARPLDLFESDRPAYFELPISMPFAQWSIVALLNYSDGIVEKTIPLDRLRLPGAAACLAFEFWTQRFVGELEGALKVRIEPETVALLSVHPRTGVPRVVSTSRHFTQGAVELERVDWDETSKTLSGTSRGPVGSAHDVSIHVPPRYRWKSDRPDYFQERESYSIEPIEPRILRVRVRFEAATTTAWKVELTTAPSA